MTWASRLAACLLLLLLVLLFWGIARLLRAIFRQAVEEVTEESLIKKLACYAVVTLGFAARDILSNFVSGILLLWRPFQIGDQMQAGGSEGTVERMELRAMLIRAYDGRVVLVQDAAVFAFRSSTTPPIRCVAAALRAAGAGLPNPDLSVLAPQVPARWSAAAGGAGRRS